MSVPFPTPTVGLTSLSIRNFRGIEHLDLDFRDPEGHSNSLVVLAGPNGCGKTAVLEAALIAMGRADLAIGPSKARAIRRGARDYKIHAEVSIADQAVNIEVSSSELLLTRVVAPVWYFSSWRAPRLIGPVDVTVGRLDRRPVENDLDRLKNVKQILVNAAAVERFSQQQVLLGHYSRWIDRINEAWQAFYPEAKPAFQVDLSVSNEPGSGSFDVFFEATDGSRLTVDDLSSGQLELFLFLSTLVLNDDREGIVLIDEPELHLDPQWHRPIMRSLVRLQPKAQFIVATHSPEIYDAATSYERHYLVPEDDPRARLWRAVETGA